ncbi:hypothetical protein F2Q70_00010340 [Brassica cretica]|uniref:Uncharacterized protein n=1 Tax=Brassica cretica TaxID=69181 RepID=A0A8S9MEH8_BRACR|nr:hypothetical protein F2Q70_00010340 [Brassica cretica]
MRVFNSTLDESFREACLSHFKAEEIERKFIRFQNEVAERERRQAESHSRALIRAERKGRRTIAAELARRTTLFDAEFKSFKDAKDYVGAAVRLVPSGSRRTLISLFSPRLLRCRASWMGAPRASRLFLQLRGGSDSFGNPSRFQRTRLIWSLDVRAECGRLLFECAMALQGHLTMYTGLPLVASNPSRSAAFLYITNVLSILWVLVYTSAKCRGKDTTSHF